MARKYTSHEVCDHPATKAGRSACRYGKREVPEKVEKRETSHAECDHPKTKNDRRRCRTWRMALLSIMSDDAQSDESESTS
ncbi:hypothetical protein [Streptomyces sp. NPDC050388]|uniref:hypothetical protein n=1 Tax=Streptomyces sp. NPDC050388 TaxID=3155781 RepID=UPI0034279894